MNPAALVLSYGKTSANEIVENILLEMNQPEILITQTHNERLINLYKCDIQTKYYSNSISLIPFDGKCDDIPLDVVKTIEALIIYFDPKDKSFLNLLPDINNFYKSSNIQLGFLITKSMHGGASEISYQTLKEYTNFLFDIITLTKEDDDGEESNCNIGYKDIVEGLRNFVWSNITPPSNMNLNESRDDDELELQLNDFENLLIAAQNLRCDATLNRDEFLDKAEKLAEAMSKIVNESD